MFPWPRSKDQEQQQIFSTIEKSVYYDHTSICYLITFFLKWNTSSKPNYYLQYIEASYSRIYGMLLLQSTKVLITECIRDGTFFRRTKRICCVPSLNTIVSLVLCERKGMGGPSVEIPFSLCMTSIYLVIQSGELASNMQHSITIAAAKAMMLNRAM